MQFLGYLGKSEDLLKETINDQETCFIAESLRQKDKRKIEAEILKLQSDLNSALNEISKESETIGQLKAKLAEQQDNLQSVLSLIGQCRDQRIEKEKIAAEQMHLTNPKNCQVKNYYETLLSNLCASFQSIALVNTPSSILQKESEKITQISNIGNRSNKIIKDSHTSLFSSIWNHLCNAGNHIVEITSLLKPLTQLIPQEIPIVGAIPSAINAIANINSRSKIKNTEDAFKGLTPKKLERIADEIARKITFTYEEQISLLSEDSAQKLALNASECITAALFNGQIKDGENLVIYAWLSIRNLKNSYNTKVPLLGYQIPFTKEPLYSTDGKQKFTASDLYHKSGIKFYDENKKLIQCPLKQGEDPEKYKWIRITKEELKNYFPKYTSKTQESSSTSVGFDLKTPEPEQEKSYLIGERNSIQEIHRLSERIAAMEKKQAQRDRQIKQLQYEEQIDKSELKELKKISKTIMSGKVSSEYNAEPPVRLEASNLSSKTVLHLTTKFQTLTTPPAKSISSMNEPKHHKDTSTSKCYALKTPVGLPNITNSCYINVALQVIFNNPSILNKIKSENETGGNAFIKALNEIIKVIHSPGSNKDSCLKEQLGELRKSLIGTNLEQQDANEFLCKILANLNWKPILIRGREIGILENGEEITSNIGISNNEAALDIAIQNDDSFKNILRRHLEAGDIKTPIILKGVEFKTWKKQIIIENEPEYIIVLLTRGTNKMHKNHAAIQFPSNQKVQIECNSKTSDYEIVSYINHDGDSLYSGHYTAYIKSEADGNWYFCNDSFVRQQTPQSNEKTACIVILQKKPENVIL